MRSSFFAVLLAALPLLVQALPTSQGGEHFARNDGRLFRRGAPSDKDLLLSCPGAAGSPNVQRADRCTLINIVNNPDEIVFKNVGNPQLNCAGGTGPTTVTLGGSSTVTTETSVNANLGASFEGINVGGGISTSESHAEQTSNLTKYDVPPGRQAVYTAGYTFHSQTGNIEVNYGDRVGGHYKWFTGVTVTKKTPNNDAVPQYQVHETKCGTDPNDLNNKS
ncbi:hypothetical protein FPV67DRAFT_770622 [Lyophyllum atratum]|nr:hypothetical protein FPV67DRAFT_770622 [Lyophyllum atratum]